MAEWLLYEHDDGRHAVAPSAEAATFATGDPAWHRVGPVEVPDDDGSPAPEAAATPRAAAPAPRFQETSCSQCGGEFGPGNQGYSHCEDHSSTTGDGGRHG